MSTNIKYGEMGVHVVALKQLLNSKRRTRLPRLNTHNIFFDLITYARVMEFQHYRRIGVDGIVGKKTKKRLGGNFKDIVADVQSDIKNFLTPFIDGTLHGKSTPLPSTVPPSGSSIVIDLHGRELIAYDGGVQKLHFNPIRGGIGTRKGVFHMSSRRLRKHTSSLYPDPPGNMDYSLFFDGARAIHQGPPRETSHGCIHVGQAGDYIGTITHKTAEDLFNWAAKKNILVIVCKLPKGLP